MTVSVLAIDAGTTGVTALVVSERGDVLARGYQEFPQHFPADGWVEHEPGEIWSATLAAVRAALAATDEVPTAVGITNQRETAVLWDRETLGSPRRAIVWQDRRTAPGCEELRAAGHEPAVTAATGLRLDPYFTGTKLRWIAEHEPHTWAQVTSGRVAVGTVDSYLIARMTRGLSHITDHSNASRTLLYDLALRNWSPALCDLFGVPIDALPEIVASYGRVAMTDPRTFQGLEIPIAGIAGDQQSALFGQGCFNPGSSKCTYGTGAFVLVNTGDTPAFSDTGLLTTVAWGHPDGRIDYALEGSVFVAGAAVQWLRDGLGLISSSQQTEELASSVPDSGGVVFVPALTGLGAPAWDPFARGMIIGITRGTTRAHIVRATLEGIAFQVSDVVDLFVDAGHRQIVELAVDGGAAQNNLLCQIQADQLQIPVCRTSVLETTGLGAAFLAGLGTGVWSSTDELAAIRRVDRTFAPSFTSSSGGSRRSWRDAVERSRGWARDEQIEG